MAEAKTIGVYICSGHGIGDAIDCDLLKEKLEGEAQVKVCKVLENLISLEGVEEIKRDIQDQGLDTLVIGASSPRYHTDLFDFGPDIVVDRVSLRELVAWTHEPQHEYTQDLARDYMMMGLAKVRIATPPDPLVVDINSNIMVVGGGFTGMQAALSTARAGYNTVLVEKAAELGGFYRKLFKLTPTQYPYLEPEPNQCESLVAEVLADPKIEVLTEAEIEKTKGAPGQFDVTVKTNGKTLEFQVGSIIQATGWKQHDAAVYEPFGWGKTPNVITNVEMEERAKNGEVNRPSDGKPLENVVFIQCVGRSQNSDLYCSTVCCMTSLKQALYVRDKYPNSRIFVIYRDMRTPGQYELFYKRVQTEDNIFFTKGEVAGVEIRDDGRVDVEIEGTLFEENISINADLVVLATGMKPSTLVEENTNTTKQGAKPEPANILNLTYRQGPDLPILKYGFPDSHYICFPYETRRTGIYAAGTVRSPMDLVGCKNDAQGAALKAIQIIESAKRGEAVHPRSGDTSFPDFFLQRCTQCKRCTEECPFGTLDEDVKGTPKPNPTRCRRCGICLGACPERIISFKDYSVLMISDMIKSIYVPTEEEDDEATPRIIAFMCENDAYPALDQAAREGLQFSPHIRVIPVRCLGSVNTSWIADSLSQGFDGAILFGCKYGDDYQCHFIHGSELADKRMENVREKLKQLALEPERVELHMIEIDEYRELPNILNKFANLIEELGPNPYKEM